MSNEITTGTEFTVTRVTKSGKRQTRGILGTIYSGNKAEREALFLAAVPGFLRGNQFASIMQELVRVFPASSLKTNLPDGIVAGSDGVIYMRNGADLTPFNPAACDSRSVISYARAIVAKYGDKELKGEKAVFLQVARATIERGAEKERFAAEAAKAIEA